MLTSDNLASETESIRRFIEIKWEELRKNARHGHQDRFPDWELLAATSIDGHLDDLDPENPYILFLPNDFITPGGRFMVQFYWDSYFVVRPLLEAGQFELAKGIVDNCLFLVERHGMVIANRKRWAAGSQLPFLSRMMREIYDASRDKTWLTQSIKTVEKEYIGYWTNSDHSVFRGLSRFHAPSCYPAKSLPEITMDHEATWDLSPRFDKDDVLHLLPVDLNANLWAYEDDLAFFCDELGRLEEAKGWRAKAQCRLKTINDLMWDDQDGIYYDYNFCLGRRKKIKSMATYFPLFHGIADDSQAQRVCDALPLFERAHGLAACDQSYGYADRQWNYPVGWAPLHLVAFEGLTKYGHNGPAHRVALKWLNLNLLIWNKTVKLYEKYDVETGSAEVLVDRYKNQDGFAWTNGVFLTLFNALVSSGGGSGGLHGERRD